MYFKEFFLGCCKNVIKKVNKSVKKCLLGFNKNFFFRFLSSILASETIEGMIYFWLQDKDFK